MMCDECQLWRFAFHMYLFVCCTLCTFFFLLFRSFVRSFVHVILRCNVCLATQLTVLLFLLLLSILLLHTRIDIYVGVASLFHDELFFFFLFSSVGKCEHTPMTRVHSLPCTFSLVLANLKLIASRLNACVGDPEGDRLHLLQYLFFLFLFCFTFLFNYVLDVSFIMICVLVAYGMQFLFCFFPELVNMLKKEEKRVKDRSDGCFSLFTCV